MKRITINTLCNSKEDYQDGLSLLLIEEDGTEKSVTYFPNKRYYTSASMAVKAIMQGIRRSFIGYVPDSYVKEKAMEYVKSFYNPKTHILSSYVETDSKIQSAE